ncbi:SDR family oxidoreductase [Myceligenerans salitolerans]|uniref:SDR family oxidoreductase n=1 Tax=Myceligenerans salitolerans TaxID=1230528 RepID=A0ABS3IBC6_9MICO|nr:SDR family oxidoreductase [Myceligenerans salitolerans]MBO0610341.1 SDR family oxidoreductase [Myceligenerans salitolerans]
MRVAIAGGTGLVGRAVADEAVTRGHETVVLARSRGIELTTGTGLDHALRGCTAVIDVTNVATMKAGASTRFFEDVTRTLLTAERRAGVERHVALSIVGVDRAPFDYYAGKRAQELAVEAGPVPWTVLRATQFHEFAEQIHATAKAGPLHLAPKMRTQPIAVREVASRLVDLAEASAVGGYVELAGPEEESLVDMVRRWARATGRRGWIPAVALPGGLGRAQRDGTLLPGAGAEIGVETFTAWLERTTGRRSSGRREPQGT